jgi:Tat protein translocase TatB subunit
VGHPEGRLTASYLTAGTRVGSLGFSEMLVVLVIALLVFGPERLPELARNAGKAIAKFRSEASKSVEELKRAADLQGVDEDIRGITKDVRELRSSVTGALTGAGAATGTTRAPDRPPPTDPEAT